MAAKQEAQVPAVRALVARDEPTDGDGDERRLAVDLREALQADTRHGRIPSARIR